MLSASVTNNSKSSAVKWQEMEYNQFADAVSLHTFRCCKFIYNLVCDAHSQLNVFKTFINERKMFY